MKIFLWFCILKILNISEQFLSYAATTATYSAIQIKVWRLKKYIFVRATLIEFCKNLLSKLHYHSELYSEHCQTSRMEMFGKTFSVLLLAVTFFFLSNASSQMFNRVLITHFSSMHRYLPFFIKNVSMYFENTTVLKLLKNSPKKMVRKVFKIFLLNNQQN